VTRTVATGQAAPAAADIVSGEVATVTPREVEVDLPGRIGLPPDLSVLSREELTEWGRNTVQFGERAQELTQWALGPSYVGVSAENGS
jgi:hypothetical protein